MRRMRLSDVEDNDVEIRFNSPYTLVDESHYGEEAEYEVV